MSLSVGIVGLPNVGKSTLFNALTDQAVPADNYPFCTIDPTVGIVPVADDRLDQLCEFSSSEKRVPAAFEFVDIAGLIKGASEGEGLGNEFLENIRGVDAIAHVVRVFENEDVHHMEADIDPVRDIEVINLELVLADQERVKGRLDSLERDVKSGDKDLIKEKDLLDDVNELLSNGKMANEREYTEDELKILRKIGILSRKKMLYVFNVSGESDVNALEESLAYVDESGDKYILIDIALEDDIKGLEKDERSDFRKETGLEISGLDDLIISGFDLLNLISFFTTGEKESRAWPIPRGFSAPQAAGRIHSDFEEKFIRAEVIEWQKLIEAGSRANARSSGLIRTEGKEYIVQDGDVVEFLHG